MFVIRRKDLLDNNTETYLTAKPSKSEASDELHLYFKNKNVKLGPNKTDEGLFYEVEMSTKVPFGVNKAIETKNTAVVIPDGYILSGSREIKTEQVAEYDIVEIPATLVVNFLSNGKTITETTEPQKSLVHIVYQPKSETVELFIADKEVMIKYKDHVQTVVKTMDKVLNACTIKKEETIDAAPEPKLCNNLVTSNQGFAEPKKKTPIYYTPDELKLLPKDTVVDARDFRGYWYPAKIIAPYNAETGKIRVHYGGYSSDCNENLDINSEKLAKHKSIANKNYIDVGAKAYNPDDPIDRKYLLENNYVYSAKNFHEIQVGDIIETWNIYEWRRKTVHAKNDTYVKNYAYEYLDYQCAKLRTFTTS